MGVQGLSVPHLYQPSQKPPHVPDQMGHTPSPLRVSLLSPEAIKQGKTASWGEDSNADLSIGVCAGEVA